MRQSLNSPPALQEAPATPCDQTVTRPAGCYHLSWRCRHVRHTYAADRFSTRAAGCIRVLPMNYTKLRMNMLIESMGGEKESLQGIVG